MSTFVFEPDARAGCHRHAVSRGVRGGIKGAWPTGGGYGAYEVLSWATKFFADARERYARGWRPAWG